MSKTYTAIGFEVTQLGGVTSFINNTPYTLEVRTVAIPPKRKTRVLIFINAGEFKILDYQYNILDLSQLSFRLLPIEVKNNV